MGITSFRHYTFCITKGFPMRYVVERPIPLPWIISPISLSLHVGNCVHAVTCIQVPVHYVAIRKSFRMVTSLGALSVSTTGLFRTNTLPITSCRLFNRTSLRMVLWQPLLIVILIFGHLMPNGIFINGRRTLSTSVDTRWSLLDGAQNKGSITGLSRIHGGRIGGTEATFASSVVETNVILNRVVSVYCPNFMKFLWRPIGMTSYCITMSTKTILKI